MSCVQSFSSMLPSLNVGIPSISGDERPEERWDLEIEASASASSFVHPVGIPINCSHASAVGSRLGLFCKTILAIISCAQLALPVIPLFVVFLKRPFEVIGKFSGFHSFTSIAVAVGVVV